MISTTQKRILRNFTSVVLSIILWYILSLIIHAPLILPYPHMVVKRLFILFAASSFWMAFLFTFLRVLLAFFLTLIAGFFLGLLSADFKIVKDLLTFPLSIIRTVPVISFILLAVFWFKSDFVPVFVAFIMALPVMLTACEKGFSMNKEVQEKLFKAECFGFTGFKAFRYIRFPSALPALCSGVESSFGLCWKVVAASEVISIPKHAAGSIMQKAQVHLETCDLLAATLALVLFSLAFQKVLTKICLSSILRKSV